MKFVAFLAILFVIVDLSEHIPVLRNCPPDITLDGEFLNSCGIITCNDSGNISSLLACAWGACRNSHGYKKDDNTKLYPRCCGGPICY